MRALSASELLDTWERGFAGQPIEQGLILLAAACPESSFEELTQLSIGRRDAQLLKLREMIFGSLRDVHALASQYGWRESDILRMSARRRQFYLEMIEK